jgi:hypothetical protein
MILEIKYHILVNKKYDNRNNFVPFGTKFAHFGAKSEQVRTFSELFSYISEQLRTKFSELPFFY